MTQIPAPSLLLLLQQNEPVHPFLAPPLTRNQRVGPGRTPRTRRNPDKTLPRPPLSTFPAPTPISSPSPSPQLLLLMMHRPRRSPTTTDPSHTFPTPRIPSRLPFQTNTCPFPASMDDVSPSPTPFTSPSETQRAARRPPTSPAPAMRTCFSSSSYRRGG